MYEFDQEMLNFILKLFEIPIIIVIVSGVIVLLDKGLRCIFKL